MDLPNFSTVGAVWEIWKIARLGREEIIAGKFKLKDGSHYRVLDASEVYELEAAWSASLAEFGPRHGS